MTVLLYFLPKLLWCKVSEITFLIFCDHPQDSLSWCWKSIPSLIISKLICSDLFYSPNEFPLVLTEKFTDSDLRIFLFKARLFILTFVETYRAIIHRWSGKYTNMLQVTKQRIQHTYNKQKGLSSSLEAIFVLFY